MELESGSSSVGRCRSRGRRRASGGDPESGRRAYRSGRRRDGLGHQIETYDC